MKGRRQRRLESSPGDADDIAVLDRPAISRINGSDHNPRSIESRYQAVIESIDVGLTVIDTDFNIVLANTKQASFVHSTPHKLVGKKCYREYEGRKSVCPHCPAAQAIARRQPVEIETNGHRLHGSKVAMHIKAMPTFDRRGAVDGVVEVVEDITKRQQTQQALERAKEAVEAANRGRANFWRTSAMKSARL